MTEDQEIARVLRDQFSRRLCGAEIAVCEIVADGGHLDAKGKWISESARTMFEQLKTEFSAEIGRALEGRAA